MVSQHRAATEWIEKFSESQNQKDYPKSKKLRVEIMDETKFYCQQKWYSYLNTKIPFSEEKEVQQQIESTKLYPYAENNLFKRERKLRLKTKICVIKDDCLEVALILKNGGYNPVLLNMACHKSPGGGYKYGAGAQEENLFRRTNYYLSLETKRSWYPLPPFSAIYSPSVTVFRDTEKSGYSFLPKPQDLSFIAMPAYNKPPLQNIENENSQKNTQNSQPLLLTEEYAKYTKQKMRIIFQIALENNHDAVVLSAMGCGAFKNPPRHIAQLFKEVLNEEAFRGVFRLVVFAIFDDGNSGLVHNQEGNFQPFLDVFSLPIGPDYIKVDWKEINEKSSKKRKHSDNENQTNPSKSSKFPKEYLMNNHHTETSHYFMDTKSSKIQKENSISMECLPTTVLEDSSDCIQCFPCLYYPLERTFNLTYNHKSKGCGRRLTQSSKRVSNKENFCQIISSLYGRKIFE